VKKIYPQCIKRKLWSAIQVTTASSFCAVVDLVLASPSRYRGFVTQESFLLQDVINNRFGACYR
jgi:saccharopine dehydrogenase-like NADP-dependent oxidoreductase